MIGPSVIVALEQATAAWVTGLSLCCIPQMAYESLTHRKNCPILDPNWDSWPASKSRFPRGSGRPSPFNQRSLRQRCSQVRANHPGTHRTAPLWPSSDTGASCFDHHPS